eukprot:CAMPEP_0167758230 /NCGR_PEP_ID=MMETSP0110_2-20121227/10355_1 /TAXON_ID=629695 /ORGANISM="Gymnochlora sp., Strain CCMP2014" /LENGTH=142 /DNA_ID=CAMNT_0007644487 /DNA_START=273 /DNA_END=701 /DNA_ORIENTATION=-
MEAAVSLFAEKLTYEDTLFPGVFKDRETLKKHLYTCADSLPETFRFVVDDLAIAPIDTEGITKIGVQWHVGLDDGTQLPFTRGCSLYKVNKEGEIIYGFDVPEPTAKTGALSLQLLRLVNPLLVQLQKMKSNRQAQASSGDQ